MSASLFDILRVGHWPRGDVQLRDRITEVAGICPIAEFQMVHECEHFPTCLGFANLK